MSKAFSAAVRLLARREHGAHELASKLLKKGHMESDIQLAIGDCQRLGLQSDDRFAEGFCRVRIRQGYGPLRIHQELKQLQIDSDLIEEVLRLEQDNWLSHAMAVWNKKFNEQQDVSFELIQKQKKFLLYRGFPSDLITMMFKDKSYTS
jgi:regulatory protein